MIESAAQVSTSDHRGIKDLIQKLKDEVLKCENEQRPKLGKLLEIVKSAMSQCNNSNVKQMLQHIFNDIQTNATKSQLMDASFTESRLVATGKNLDTQLLIQQNNESQDAPDVVLNDQYLLRTGLSVNDQIRQTLPYYHNNNLSYEPFNASKLKSFNVMRTTQPDQSAQYEKTEKRKLFGPSKQIDAQNEQERMSSMEMEVYHIRNENRNFAQRFEDQAKIIGEQHRQIEELKSELKQLNLQKQRNNVQIHKPENNELNNQANKNNLNSQKPEKQQNPTEPINIDKLQEILKLRMQKNAEDEEKKFEQEKMNTLILNVMSDNKSLTYKLRDMDSEQQALKQKLIYQINSNKQYEQIINEHIVQQQALQKDNETLQTENYQLQIENEEIKQQLALQAQISDDNTRQSQINKTLIKQIQKQKAQIQRLHDKNNTLQIQNSKLHTQQHEMQAVHIQQIQDMNDNINNLQNQFDEIYAENTTLHQQYEQNMKQIQQLLLQNSDKDNMIQELKQGIQTCSLQNQEFMDKIIQLEQQNNELQLQIQNINDYLSESQAQHELEIQKFNEETIQVKKDNDSKQKTINKLQNIISKVNNQHYNCFMSKNLQVSMSHSSYGSLQNDNNSIGNISVEPNQSNISQSGPLKKTDLRVEKLNNDDMIIYNDKYSNEQVDSITSVDFTHEELQNIYRSIKDLTGYEFIQQMKNTMNKIDMEKIGIEHTWGFLRYNQQYFKDFYDQQSTEMQLNAQEVIQIIIDPTYDGLQLFCQILGLQYVLDPDFIMCFKMYISLESFDRFWNNFKRLLNRLNLEQNSSTEGNIIYDMSFAFCLFQFNIMKPSGKYPFLMNMMVKQLQGINFAIYNEKYKNQLKQILEQLVDLLKTQDYGNSNLGTKALGLIHQAIEMSTDTGLRVIFQISQDHICKIFGISVSGTPVQENVKLDARSLKPADIIEQNQFSNRQKPSDNTNEFENNPNAHPRSTQGSERRVSFQNDISSDDKARLMKQSLQQLSLAMKNNIENQRHINSMLDQNSSFESIGAKNLEPVPQSRLYNEQNQQHYNHQNHNNMNKPQQARKQISSYDSFNNDDHQGVQFIPELNTVEVLPREPKPSFQDLQNQLRNSISEGQKVVEDDWSEQIQLKSDLQIASPIIQNVFRKSHSNHSDLVVTKSKSGSLNQNEKYNQYPKLDNDIHERIVKNLQNTVQSDKMNNQQLQQLVKQLNDENQMYHQTIQQYQDQVDELRSQIIQMKGKANEQPKLDIKQQISKNIAAKNMQFQQNSSLLTNTQLQSQTNVSKSTRPKIVLKRSAQAVKPRVYSEDKYVGKSTNQQENQDTIGRTISISRIPLSQTPSLKKYPLRQQNSPQVIQIMKSQRIHDFDMSIIRTYYDIHDLNEYLKLFNVTQNDAPNITGFPSYQIGFNVQDVVDALTEPQQFQQFCKEFIGLNVFIDSYSFFIIVKKIVKLMIITQQLQQFWQKFNLYNLGNIIQHDIQRQSILKALYAWACN